MTGTFGTVRSERFLSGFHCEGMDPGDGVEGSFFAKWTLGTESGDHYAVILLSRFTVVTEMSRNLATCFTVNPFCLKIQTRRFR